MEEIKNKVGLKNMIGVDCRGVSHESGGGLVLIWKKNLDVSLISYSSNHICVRVVDDTEKEWSFVGIYGHAERRRINISLSYL